MKHKIRFGKTSVLCFYCRCRLERTAFFFSLDHAHYDVKRILGKANERTAEVNGRIVKRNERICETNKNLDGTKEVKGGRKRGNRIDGLIDMPN